MAGSLMVRSTRDSVSIRSPGEARLRVAGRFQQQPVETVKASGHEGERARPAMASSGAAAASAAPIPGGWVVA
jgi:hypothetical protein